MIADRLAPIRARFVQRSLRECEEIGAALRANAPDLAAIGALAHRIAGAGGTLGLPAIGDAAMRLEDACDARDTPGARDAADTLGRLVAALAPEALGSVPPRAAL